MPQQRVPPPSDAATTFGGLSRSALMSRVRSRGNATTEMRMVSLLRQRGITGWSRHERLVGHPDFCWTSEKVVLFVHGCFWHGHGCGRNLTPRSNRELWSRKIAANCQRDQRTARALRRLGWSVLTAWECELSRNPWNCIRRLENKLAARRSRLPSS